MCPVFPVAKSLSMRPGVTEASLSWTIEGNFTKILVICQVQMNPEGTVMVCIISIHVLIVKLSWKLSKFYQPNFDNIIGQFVNNYTCMYLLWRDILHSSKPLNAIINVVGKVSVSWSLFFFAGHWTDCRFSATLCLPTEKLKTQHTVLCKGTLCSFWEKMGKVVWPTVLHHM